MSAPWTAHIPASCDVGWLERGSIDQLGGMPPVRVVPVQTKKTTKSIVSLKVAGGVKMEVTKFSGGSSEEALRHVQLFWSLEAKFQYRQKLVNARQTKKAQEEARDLIRDDDSHASQSREEYDQRIGECKETIKGYRADLWGLFEQLLDAPLLPNWKEIVKHKTSTEGGSRDA